MLFNLLIFTMLATVSDSLKVFEFKSPELTAVSTRGAFDGRLTTVAWNHTNQVVAVAGTARVIHLIQASNGQLLSEVPFSSSQERAILHSDSHIMNDITAIAFSNSSRYLASSSGTSVHIWDLKKRNLCSVKQIGKCNISTVLFLPDGSRVISGNQEGQVDIWDFDQTSDVSSLNTSAFVPTPLTCMDISLGSQSKLACGYTDGAVNLWDLNTSMHIRHQRIHDGKLAGLSFSPKNSRLLATAGHDGRINLVDTASKSISDPSASVNVGERLTCISFSDDAIHSAVGTENGHIFIYDWRNLRSPVCVVEAHAPAPVTALRFQGILKSNAPSSARKVAPAPTAQEASSFNSNASVLSDVTENSIARLPSAPPQPLSSSLAVLKDSAVGASVEANTSTKKNFTPGKATSDTSAHTRSLGNNYIRSVDGGEKVKEAGLSLHPRLKVEVSDTEELLTASKLKEALEIFRYDMHKELQVVLKEQVRQFAIAKVEF